MKITTTRIINSFFFIFEFFLIVLISLLFYLSKPYESEAIIFVPQGSIREIIAKFNEKNARNLAEFGGNSTLNSNENLGQISAKISQNKNANKLSKIDLFVLRFFGNPQAGWIEIGSEKLSRLDFLYKLSTAKAALSTITLIPGETTAYFFRQISMQLNLDENALNSAYAQMAEFSEGMLFPESYKIPRGMDEQTLIKTLLEQSNAAFKKAFPNLSKDELRALIIKASIIQKEAASIDEMPIVASVIENRLKIGMKLQMDGALNYGLFSHAKITPERIRNDNSIFNTYKIAALPSEAVCNVSLDAIRAAQSPAKSDFLYFMRDKSTGKHIFTSNAKDHEKAIDSQRKK